MRKYAISIAVATAVVLGAPAVAHAATEPPADPYGGTTPREPTLAGSTVSPTCDDDVPWIRYRVILTDPDSRSASTNASLVLQGGGSSVTIPLGDVAGGVVEGAVLWPGASVTDGVASGWPGWEFVDGEWRETSGNYAWTRGAISATIEVNPSIPVALSYPPASSHCVDPPGQVASLTSTSAQLPATGGDATAVAAVAVAGGVLVVGGALAVAARRRRRA